MSKLSEKWEQGSYMTAVSPKPIRVQGYINKPFGIDNFARRPRKFKSSGFALIHLKTGFMLGNFPTLKLAKLCAEEIAPRHAWERVTTSRKRGERWSQTFAIINHAQMGEI